MTRTPTPTLRRLLAAFAVSGFLAISTAVPAAAVTDPGPPIPATSGAGGTVVREVAVDDNGPEYLQIGLGALGGIALVGAGALVLGGSQRRSVRRTMHPA